MKTNRLFGAAFGLAVLSMIAGLAMASPPDAPLIVTAADADKSVSLASDQDLHVKLSAQFGTGYSWRLAASSTPLLRLKSSKDLGGATMPGAAETQRLVFAPTGTGTGILKLEYRRPWVKDQPPAKTFAVTVTIR